MKIRACFSKEGRVKYIGHLDLLRLFQRVIKSAEIPIAYSNGYNPHSLLYFAQPLSVGVTSTGEYMDIHLQEDMDVDLIKEKMNRVLPEGLRIETVVVLPEASKAAMTLVDAAEYTISFSKKEIDEDFINITKTFYEQDEILVTRVSKKKEKVINIKEFLHKLDVTQDEDFYYIEVTLAAGSRSNLNPDLFVSPLIEKLGFKGTCKIHRDNLLTLDNEKLISLAEIG